MDLGHTSQPAYLLSPFQEWLLRDGRGRSPVTAGLEIDGIGRDALAERLERAAAAFPLGRVMAVPHGAAGHILRVAPHAVPTARWSDHGGVVTATPSPVADPGRPGRPGTGPAHDAGAFSLRAVRTGATSWRLTVAVTAALGDAVTARLLQRAVAAALFDQEIPASDLESMLRFMQWHRALLEAAGSSADTARGTGRADLAAMRARSACPHPAWTTRELGTPATTALRRSADALGVAGEAVLLSAWRLTVGLLAEDSPEPDVCVAVDGRHGPVPAGLVGQATPWTRWPGDRPAGGTAGHLLTATAAWLSDLRDTPRGFHEGDPTGPGVPDIAFETVPAAETLTADGTRVTMLAPVPVHTGGLLTLVPASGTHLGDVGLWYDSAALHQDDAERILDTYTGVLTDLPDHLAGSRRRLGERSRGASAAAAFPPPACPPGTQLWRRVVAKAEATPGAAAVSDGDTTLTYQGLVTAARDLAEALRDHGVGTDDTVGVFLDPGPAAVVAILAVLAAGGGYMPLDPGLPPARREAMLRSACARLVIRPQGHTGSLPDGVHALPVDPAGALEPSHGRPCRDGRRASRPALPDGGPDALAYVLFTSGTTGRPKGVMVTRRGLETYLRWAVDTYPFTGGSAVVSHTPLTFDLTVTGLLVPLAAGAHVRCVPPAAPTDVLLETLKEVGDVSLVKLTPAHLTLLNALRHRAGNLRVRSVVVGERNSPSTRWRNGAAGSRAAVSSTSTGRPRPRWDAASGRSTAQSAATRECRSATRSTALASPWSSRTTVARCATVCPANSSWPGTAWPGATRKTPARPPNASGPTPAGRPAPGCT